MKPNPTAKELIKEIQIGALYADNTEPAMTNQRKIYLDQLTTDLLELIGEDEVKSVDPVHSGVAQRTRNEFRAELRKKLKAYLNGGK